ncbi:PREDICTED: uncharacterized mitochondrial protein AtMg00810-like [Fragaria vesca subsp. vesca]
MVTSVVPTIIEPTCFSQAIKQVEWREAMATEFNALQVSGTWSLVPPKASMNVLPNKWVFCIKRKSDGSIEWYKARLVANGFHQQEGIDYAKTFSPVVKHTTIRTVIALATHFNWPIRQLDVQNAFLHGYISEEVYMRQLAEVVPHGTQVHLTQSKYAVDLLRKTKFQDVKPLSSPAAHGKRLSVNDGDVLVDPSEYRSVVGALQYLTVTRHDLAFAVNQVYQYMHRPTTSHWMAVKRILRFVKSTYDHGLVYSPGNLQLQAFSDADCAGEPDERHYTGGYCIALEIIVWAQFILVIL